MKSIQKYLRKKTADGTVSKAVVATLLLFNLAYFTSLFLVWVVQVQADGGKKLNFNFLKDTADPRTYFYIIASSIISAILISSFIFHKVKTERTVYNTIRDFEPKVMTLLLDDAKKDEIEKITISLDHKGLIIMPGKNVIEIPVIQGSTENEKLREVNEPFKEVTFTITQPFFGSSKNKSIYPEVIGSQKAYDAINKIKGSKIFFFKKTDHDKYHNSGSSNVRYQYDTAYLSDKKTQKPADKIFNFTDLYNISSIKLHYADCSSTEVKLKLKEEPAADMELCEYVNANRPHPLGNIKEPQVAFIPAIAGNRPIFSGGLYKSIPTGVSV
ncbi:MAG: hypothetical protein sL5_08900 [Candidatus Mesenet longicola]|uniref:Uncharacterized protein n=1 Tax=Candidatus Mesenet longicola TaxID=1892558 RepID=A0A8J3MN69_9RICK|nr:MAG: hypothetical protein sGL2_04240 [Candidatus Mesenet longicola]GHM59897.1 MAG: hypothetical protein sL5_08900 [Candidatus Mesenet longicola]